MFKLSNLLLLFAVISLSFGLMSCEVEQTREGEMPEVELETQSGQMPAYDVNWADVDVGTKTKMVKVPKVRVVMEEEEIEVPYMDFDMPDGGEKEEQTIRVEAEVEGEMQELDISEVYVTGNRLYVISTLEPTGEDLQDERVRVSDQIILNAPDLVVRHYIIGEQPAGDFNNQYYYVDSREEIADKLTNGKQIYSNS